MWAITNWQKLLLAERPRAIANVIFPKLPFKLENSSHTKRFRKFFSTSNGSDEGYHMNQNEKVGDEGTGMRGMVVVGAGQMGTGIALVGARGMMMDGKIGGGCRVLLYDMSEEQLRRSGEFVRRWLVRQVEKGEMTQDSAEEMRCSIAYALLRDDSENGDSDSASAVVMGVGGNVWEPQRGSSGVDSEGCSRVISADGEIGGMAVDLCVEAVSEKYEVKRRVFQWMDGYLLKFTGGERAVMASNTSSISITKLAAATTRPENVVGMHFMNPVPVMPLVEVISGLATSRMTLSRTIQYAKLMGKITAQALDRPGFVSNRILMPYINEAIFTLQENIASPQDIDNIMKLGTNVPMGPLTLADFIGLDTCLNILNVLHQQLGEDKYRPAPLLTLYVSAGWLGRKTSKGFFTY